MIDDMISTNECQWCKEHFLHNPHVAIKMDIPKDAIVMHLDCYEKLLTGYGKYLEEKK